MSGGLDACLYPFDVTENAVAGYGHIHNGVCTGNEIPAEKTRGGLKERRGDYKGLLVSILDKFVMSSITRARRLRTLYI